MVVVWNVLFVTMQGCILVTDAMAAMGLGAGHHHLGSSDVRVCGGMICPGQVQVTIDDHGRATVTGTDTLAGRLEVFPLFVCLFV